MKTPKSPTMKPSNSKKKKAVLRYVLLSVVALIIGINLYSCNATKLAGNAMPMPFGIGGAVVLSGSMEPTLSVGDFVLIKAEDSYEVDDIVVYQSGSGLVIHRVLQTDGQTLVTRGDANNVNDDPVPVIYVKGRLICAIPYVGTLVRLIKSLPGTLVLIAAAVVLMERSFRKEKMKDMEKMDLIKDEIRRLQAELDEEKGE